MCKKECCANCERGIGTTRVLCEEPSSKYYDELVSGTNTCEYCTVNMTQEEFKKYQEE